MLAQLWDRTRLTVGLPSLFLPTAQNQGGRAVAVRLGLLRAWAVEGCVVVAAVWLGQEGSGPAMPESLTQTPRTLLKRNAGSAWRFVELVLSSVRSCCCCCLQDFLKCLNLYAQEIISRNELVNLANVSVAAAPRLAGKGQAVQVSVLGAFSISVQQLPRNCEVLQLSCVRVDRLRVHAVSVGSVSAAANSSWRPCV